MTHDEETEVAAEVIKDLLVLIPVEKRAAALAIASRTEAEEREKRRFGPKAMSAAALMKDLPRTGYWHDIMQFKARLVYTFVRSITNNHSPEDASRLLFQLPLEQYLDQLTWNGD